MSTADEMNKKFHKHVQDREAGKTTALEEIIEIEDELVPQLKAMVELLFLAMPENTLSEEGKNGVINISSNTFKKLDEKLEKVREELFSKKSKE